MQLVGVLSSCVEVPSLRAAAARPDLTHAFGRAALYCLLQHSFPRASWPADSRARIRMPSGVGDSDDELRLSALSIDVDAEQSGSRRGHPPWQAMWRFPSSRARAMSLHLTDAAHAWDTLRALRLLR